MINHTMSSIFIVPICPEVTYGSTTLAQCCDVDESCNNGDDDWCCNNSFYCSNDGVEYAKDQGGILCPETDYNNIYYVDDNNRGNYI